MKLNARAKWSWMVVVAALFMSMSAFAQNDASAITAEMVEVAPEGPEVAFAQARLAEPAVAMVLDGARRICVGGDDSGEVRLIEDGNETALPDFPKPVADASAAMVDGSVYVLAGNELYSLDLSADVRSWQQHSDLPGAARFSASLHVVDNELLVFGGRSADGALLADVWGYRVKPLDGTLRTGWQQRADMPRAAAGLAIHATGQVHLALLGGEPASDKIYIYHTVTDTWIEGGELPAPVGCAAVATVDEKSWLITDEKAMELTLDRKVKTLAFMDYSVMLVYFGLMAFIGIYFARKQDSSDEFALGGRNVKWWAAGVSMFATGASSISFMAIPAQAFRTNLVWLTPTLFIIPLAILQAYVIYPVLRRLNLTSTYEYLERRYHPALRYVASAQMIVFQLIGRMSVVMLLPSLAISAVTGLPVLTSVLVMGLLTTVYTAFGGFEAVIWTDFSQGALMLFGGVLMIVLAINGLPGGMGEFIEAGKACSKFDWVIWKWDYTAPMIWIFGLQLLLANLAFAADQPVVQRVYATPLKDMRKLAGMFAFCSIAIACIVSFAGIAIFAYFRAHPELMDPGMSNDQVVPLYVVQRLPAGWAGLIIAALFAASMSTLSSSMNSVATVSCEDFYRKFFPKTSDKQRLRFMQIASLVVGAVGTGAAAYMATMNISSMFETWNVAIALLGGGFIGIYILGMFTRRSNAAGAITGALSSIVVTLLVKQYSPLHWLFYTPIAVVSCMAIGFVVSLVTGGNRKSLEGLTVFDMRRDLEE